jgi:integrase
MPRTVHPKKLPSGKWQIRWHDVFGHRQSRTFDGHNDAQQTLYRNLADVEAMRRGRLPLPPPKRTFADLTKSWMETRAVHKRSSDQDKSRLRAHLTPAFGKLDLAEITYARIEAFKAERAAVSKQTLRHLLVLLGTMLKHAHRLGWLSAVPPIDKPSVRVNALDFSYLRSTDEIQRFLRAAHDEGVDTYTLYATAVYTGMRQGELAALRWESVDLTRKLITVNHSFTGPTKASDVRYVPVLDVLLPILRAWKLRCPSGLLFPNVSGEMHQPKDRIFCERFHRVLDAAGFERPTEGRRVHYIRFHDLRHTFASHWMIAGGEIFKLQKILGHKSMELTLRYAHLSPAAFMGDLGRFDGLAIGGGADVLPITRGRNEQPKAKVADVRRQKRQIPRRASRG